MSDGWLMQSELRQAIEENYGISIHRCDAAPRGAIAETYIINGVYFCKLVRNPVITKYLRHSLPLLDCLTKAGVDRINGLIKPRDGFSVTLGDTEIVLTKLLPGRQSRDYHVPSFGALLASIHEVSVDDVTAKKSIQEDFDISFTNPLMEWIDATASCAAQVEIKAILSRHADDMSRHLDCFQALARMCQEEPCASVITHGDVQGNVLMTDPDDLYIIDWDEAVLAPRERDLWFFADQPEFMKGYGESYCINKKMLNFFTFKAYFVNTLLRIEALLKAQDDAETMAKISEQLEWRISPQGWMRPKLEAILTGTGI